MEVFKETLRKRVRFFFFVLIFATSITSILTVNRNRLPNVPEFIKGFQVGVFIGLSLIILYFISNYIATLRNEEVLRKKYIEETDERNQLIVYKSSQGIYVGMLILLSLATVVSGFFNGTVFFTLLLSLVLMLLLTIITFIYNDKMN
ncbi:hypothetical protein GOQ27_10080 [Clostridium sp. D2Q-11]|uniref:DUF2178 domain-containing protein n=1 Tax=Anaeromonas frigoriresistens TaxID=2683708 RepID=A0A942UT93_9FIRM|nr:hypothetical protein [Anaeromonas frigoriresistens]MBS4538814.1 hypothetical protein [Anaeromonas frigoriresistens]